MSKFDITTSVFYRWRYWIGYGSIFALLVFLLYIAAVMIPGGISESERLSIISSSQLSFAELWHQTPVDTPFKLLQAASLSLFGATVLGVKLPALFLGLMTAAGMILLLRRWFSRGIAVLASIIAITTGQFLFLSQQGSTGIMYLFWPTMLLLLATLVANRVRFHGIWKILFFITAALSLYTPLSIYVLLAIGSAILIHPHLRYIIRRLPLPRIIMGIVVALVLLAPLVLTIIRDPSIGLTLIGVPAQWPDILTNLRALGGQYFGFMSLGSTSILLPIFSLASMLIILFGLYRLIRTYVTVQSHVVITWIILLLPVLVVNPRFVSIMFVPLLLLLASGLEGILTRWYGLFPRNPYARVVGLIPLIVLVSSMVLFGLERYAYAYRYAPAIMQNFSNDIFLLPDVRTIVVADEELPLYQAIARYHPGLTIASSPPPSGEYAVTAAAYLPDSLPSGVVASDRSQGGVYFYLYK